MDQGRAGAVGLALLALVGCATAGGEASGGGSSNGSQIGAPAPAIRVESMSGKALALEDYRGKVVLLDVWASWCGPCKQELPMLDDMAKRLRGDGIEVLAVSVDQERANVVKFLKARPRWSLTIAHDPKGEIADRLSPEKMPTSYVIDREGVVRYVNSGFEPSDAAVIERRLVETARR
ncbi:MAG TPA: TlpA disulfide reductase family protein [Polyangia bacterium]|jgi:thiol-disulfide isomerase/thioredoxin|nr:TlpA disulfide reductase family protein [Polyangia bacterium]